MRLPTFPGLDRSSHRMFLLFSIPFLLLACALSYLMLEMNRSAAIQELDSEQRTKLAESRALLDTALSRPLRHLIGTVANPFLLQAMARPDPAERRRAIAASLSGVANRNPEYMQLRWILPNGDEAVRLDVDQETGRVSQVPQQQLQNKAGRDYHALTMGLAPRELAITEPDLNRENGQIVQPLQPTLRYGMRLPTVNEVDLGYLIFNLHFEPSAFGLGLASEKNRIYLVDENGQWIWHPDPSQRWGQPLEHGANVSNDYTRLWQAINSNGSGNPKISLSSGHWRWTPLHIGKDSKAGAVQAAPTLWLLAHLPEESLLMAQAASDRRSTTFLGLLWFFLLTFIGVFYIAQRRASRLRAQHQDTQDELAQNLRFQANLVDALPSLVAYWDEGGNLRYANAAVQRLFGLKEDSFSGQSFDTLIEPDAIDEMRRRFDRALAGETVLFEREIAVNGETRHLMTHYVPNVQSDPDDPECTHVDGVISISTDLTEVITAKRTVEALNRRLEARTLQAEETAQTKSRFLANMSHEIRTPMNAILGLLDIVRDTPLSHRQRVHIDQITASSRSLLHILNDILDLSKLEAGKLAILQESFSIAQMVHNTVQLFSAAFTKQGVELLVWIDPQLPRELVGDPQRLNQVLNNLVGNALKFTRKGQVLLSCHLVSKSDGQARVHYSVRDTGIGISADKQQRIFDYFSQADDTTTREFGGTGLGLTISRNLVHLMGGHIGVNSEDNKGSEFYFDIDHRIANDGPSREARPALRVLLVDDSDAVISVMTSYLRGWQINVDSARSLAEAQTCIQSDADPYDTIVLDDQLADGSAIDFLKDHQGAIGPSPQWVILTDHEPRDLIRDMTLAGFAETPLLKKPVTPSLLYDVLLRQHGGQLRPIDPDNETPLSLTELAHALSGKRLLLVEDNELNQEVALALLDKFGLSADTCDSGEEALAQTRTNQYDAILMDLHMPEMDGFETTCRLRSTSWGRDVPIIALSAAVLEDDIDQARGAGMNDHIAKPIEMGQLLTTLARWTLAREDRPEGHVIEPVTAPNGPSAEFHALFERMGSDPSEILRRFQGDETTVRHLLTGFGRNYANFADKLRSARDDHTALMRLLHTLKGTAGTLGLVELSHQASGAEEDLRADREPALQPLIDRLEATVAAILNYAENDPSATSPPPDSTTEAALLVELEQTISRSRVISIETQSTLEVLAQHSKQADGYRRLLHHLDQFDYAAAQTVLTQLTEGGGDV